MNQSMAVAYATLGNEFLALILRVVMVRTVVTPGEREDKNPVANQRFRAYLIRSQTFYLKGGAIPTLHSNIHLKKKAENVKVGWFYLVTTSSQFSQ